MLRWLGVSALVILLDQLTKQAVMRAMELGDQIPVLPVLSWVRWHNTGAAFSMFHDVGGLQRWFFVALAVGFAIFLVVELRRLPVGNRLMALVYALILGGALGNMLDRLFLGYVVDFVLVHYGDWYFPAFNVADSALTVGAGLWLLLMLFETLEHRRRARE